jgi:TM2 domain-containing membrane protein YozV
MLPANTLNWSQEYKSMKCANHPLNDSVAYCAQCGRPLCEPCRREVKGTSYCEPCLAARLQSPLWSSAGQHGVGASPGVALALGLIPGVGAIYNGQIVKALVQVLLFGSIIALAHRMGGPLGPIFGMGAAAFYFYMVIDSYQTARARQLGQPAPEWFGLNDLKMEAPLGAGILIVLGLLFLLDNFGVPVFSQIGKFWPVLLIVLGLALLQKRLIRHDGGGQQGHQTANPKSENQQPPGPTHL